jgi:hypothetical protein
MSNLHHGERMNDETIIIPAEDRGICADEIFGYMSPP